MTGDAFTGLDPCVHCGFCLQACPTFLITGDEADSPRGRIVLMQSLRRGAVPPTDEHLAIHLDRCLGCRACETACPSGVSYGPALEAARQQMVAVRPLPTMASIVLSVVAERRLWKPLCALVRLIRPLARWLAGWSVPRFALGMVSASVATSLPRRLDLRPPSAWRPTHDSGDRPSAVVFRGCIMDGLFGHVHRATERVLEFNGFHVDGVPGQTCCGALHAHAGRLEEARALARRNLDAFALDSNATIVVNSAGCGAMLKSYGHLMARDADQRRVASFTQRVQDIAETLAAVGPKTGTPLPLRIAYDPPCHLYHAQRVIDAPLRVLEAIPGLELVEFPNASDCCGSAGLYSLMQRDMSVQILRRKLDAIRTADPDLVVSGNPGCLMHIGAGLVADGQRARVAHPVEVLDWSYRGLGRTSRHEAS